MTLFPQYQITISTVYAVAALILLWAGFLFLWKEPRTNPLWALRWAQLCSQNKLVKSRTLFSEFAKFFPVKSFLLFQMLWFSWLELLFSCHGKMPASSGDFMESQRKGGHSSPAQTWPPGLILMKVPLHHSSLNHYVGTLPSQIFLIR